MPGRVIHAGICLLDVAFTEPVAGATHRGDPGSRAMPPAWPLTGALGARGGLQCPGDVLSFAGSVDDRPSQLGAQASVGLLWRCRSVRNVCDHGRVGPGRLSPVYARRAPEEEGMWDLQPA